jgi:hypothetical protein
MRRTGIVAGVVALVLVSGVGCAADSAETPSASSVPPNDMPACDEVYVEGATIGRDNMGKACVQNDEILSPRPVRIECTDGRELTFNDLAWGYEGEPMTLTPPDDPSKMPESEVDACVAPPEGGGSAATSTTEDDD